MSESYRVTGFEFRGQNELARLSRLVFKRPGIRIGRWFIPTGKERLDREEVLKLRGPTGPWGSVGWDKATEDEYWVAMNQALDGTRLLNEAIAAYREDAAHE